MMLEKMEVNYFSKPCYEIEEAKPWEPVVWQSLEESLTSMLPTSSPPYNNIYKCCI